jgi:hypothetical protein
VAPIERVSVAVHNLFILIMVQEIKGKTLEEIAEAWNR